MVRGISNILALAIAVSMNSGLSFAEETVCLECIVIMF